jgi:acyl-CoA-binding protein
MSTREAFDKAVADSKTIGERPDNETLLKLYSLYKQATEGDAPAEGPSNPFDIVGRAKHQAWVSISGMSADDAMQQYTALVQSLLSK